MGEAGSQRRERAPRAAIDGGDRRDTLPRGNRPLPPWSSSRLLRNSEPVNDLVTLSHRTRAHSVAPRCTVLGAPGSAAACYTWIGAISSLVWVGAFPRVGHPSAIKARTGAHHAARGLQGLTNMATCKNRLEDRDLPSDPRHSDREPPGASPGGASHRLLRLPQVIDITGLGKTKIYALQAEGRFPMRVQITPCCVGWVEQEIQAWISERISARTAALATKGSRAPRRGWPRTAIS